VIAVSDFATAQGEQGVTLLYLVAAWVAGIFLSSSHVASVTGWLVLTAISLSLVYLFRRNRSRRLFLACMALFAFGAGRYAWAARPLPADHIAHDVDSGYVTLIGLIVRDPDVRDNLTNLSVQVESIEQDSQPQPTRGLVLVQAPRQGHYTYGDRVSVSGSLLTPPEFDDFSYRDYLARRGVYALIPNARVDILAHDRGQPWYALLYDLKARAQQTINRLLPSPQAPLLSGILLGVESGIPDNVRDAFNQTGTSHIIAISGSNIIIVMGVLLGLLEPAFGKRRAARITLFGVAIYTLFVGADPAVVRAAIMGSLALLAPQSGRRAHGLTSLAFAIWLMTVWNPYTLWDVGFQLSVAATAGVVLFSRKWTQGLEGLLKRVFARQTARQVTQWLAEPVVVGLAAQVTTTPLILLYFERLSAISLVANILIVPVQAYIMTLGGLAVIVGMAWTTLGEPLAWVAWIPLTYTLDIVRALARFDWASVQVDFPPSYAWGVYGVLLVVALLIIQHPDDRAALFRRLERRISTYMIVVAGLILIILVWATAWSFPDHKLHVWFMDVGDGHAVLIETPRGAQILIDGGPSPTRLQSAVGDALPFWDHDLDMLIVTQPKSSAIDALPALFDHYTVKLVLTNGQTAGSDSYRALASAWEKQKADVLAVTAGYRIETDDGVLLEVLHPQTPPAEDAKPEDAALILRVSYGDTSFLIAPDLTSDAEQALIDAGWYIGSTVLELPARGSDTANPDFFLQKVRPQAAVVSVGAGNRAGLPDPAVQSRLQTLTGATLYRTDKNGTIEMVTDGHTLWIYPTTR
jgi:competence protein ComEC